MYYNATLMNNTIATNQGYDDPEIMFQDTRDTPIVNDISKYDMSVESFSLNGATKSLPVFIPQIQVGTNINNTIYTVTFSCFKSGTYYQNTQAVQWAPENLTLGTVIPTTATPAQVATDYYFCYSYTHWVKLLNIALRTAWSTAGGGVSFGTTCPFFTYDQNTGLFSLSQDALTAMSPIGTAIPAPFNATATASGLYASGEYSFVGFNVNMEGLMTNFDTVYYGDGVLWYGSGNKYLPEAVVDCGLVGLNTTTTITSADAVGGATLAPFFLTNPITNVATTQVYIKSTQDFISTGTLWSPVASLVLATTQIPVRAEYRSNPVTIGTSSISTSTPSSGAFQKVLIEVPINAVTADLWRGFFLYEPLTPTLSSLESSKEALTNIDVQIFWRSRLTNALYPLRMYNSGSLTLRLLFQKKGLV